MARDRVELRVAVISRIIKYVAGSFDRETASVRESAETVSA